MDNNLHYLCFNIYPILCQYQGSVHATICCGALDGKVCCPPSIHPKICFIENSNNTHVLTCGSQGRWTEILDQPVEFECECLYLAYNVLNAE